MPRSEDFQANWRGARRYQFDEEYRRKKAALEARSAATAGCGDQPERGTPDPWTRFSEEYCRGKAVLDERLETPAGHKDQPVSEVANSSMRSADSAERRMSPTARDVGLTRVGRTISVWLLAAMLAAIAFVVGFAGPTLLTKATMLLQ